MKSTKLRAAMIFGCVAMSACFAAGVPATASAQTKTIMSWGSGNDSCGKFNLAVRDFGPDKQLINRDGQFPSLAFSYMQWLAGYLTAADMYGSAASHTDLLGAYGFVAKYCADHPEAPFLSAANAFLAAQNPK